MKANKETIKTGIGGIALSALVSSNVILHNDINNLNSKLEKPKVEYVKQDIATLESELQKITYKIEAYHKGQFEQIKLAPDEVKNIMVKNGKSIALSDYENVMVIMRQIQTERGIQDSNALEVLYQTSQDEMGKIKGYIDSYNEL